MIAAWIVCRFSAHACISEGTGIIDPQVYDLEVTPDWHQIVLYNTTEEKAVVSTAISGQRVDSAIGLDSAAQYHAYEFWSDTYLGKLPGSARIERELSPNHCAMISVRKVQSHPQVISTNRHILQGWVEMKDVRWDAENRVFVQIFNRAYSETEILDSSR